MNFRFFNILCLLGIVLFLRLAYLSQEHIRFYLVFVILNNLDMFLGSPIDWEFSVLWHDTIVIIMSLTPYYFGQGVSTTFTFYTSDDPYDSSHTLTLHIFSLQ